MLRALEASTLLLGQPVISETAIRKYLRGEARFVSLKAIAEVTNCSTEWLLGTQDDESHGPKAAIRVRNVFLKKFTVYLEMCAGKIVMINPASDLFPTACMS